MSHGLSPFRRRFEFTANPQPKHCAACGKKSDGYLFSTPERTRVCRVCYDAKYGERRDAK